VEVKIAMGFYIDDDSSSSISTTIPHIQPQFHFETTKKVFLWRANAHRTVEIPMQFLLSFNPTLLLYSQFYPAVYNNTSLFRILQGEKWFIVLHSSSTRLTLSGCTNKYGKK